MGGRNREKDWRQGTSHIADLYVVEVDSPVFGDSGGDIEYENMIQDTLIQAQEDGVQYLLFLHGREGRPKGKTTGRSVLRWFVRRAVWSWDCVKRPGCRFFDEATLVEIRQPAPTEDEYTRHYDRVYDVQQRAARKRELRADALKAVQAAE